MNTTVNKEPSMNELILKLNTAADSVHSVAHSIPNGTRHPAYTVLAEADRLIRVAMRIVQFSEPYP